MGGTQQLVPPLRPGHPAARLGTDRAGRDHLCLMSRGLGRSLWVALSALLVGAVPGVALGLWLGWRGRLLALPSEVYTLLILVLLLGPGSFRLVLALGALLVTARLVAARVGTVLRETFIEGALALGGTPAQVLRRHVWPHLRPTLPAVSASVLASLFLWMMELGALGFYDQGSFTWGFDGTPGSGDTFPLNPDLGQLVSAGRWAWLSYPEQLALPALLLGLLIVALSDLARWQRRRSGDEPS